MRIVSLLPSATEVLFAIGAGDEVVGVTFECDHPPEARTRSVVSGTVLPAGLTPGEIDAAVKAAVAGGVDLYRLDEGALAGLDPDLVVSQDLCSVCAVDVGTVSAALEHLGCAGQVVTLDPHDLGEVLESVLVLGRAVRREVAAGQLLTGLRDRLAAIAALVADRPRPRVAVLEWTAPPYTSGHWVPDMVTAAGGLPVLGRSRGRSVQTDWAQLAACRPDVVVVAPCGYRLGPAVEQAEQLRTAGVLPPGVLLTAVDADAAFVRPGPRLVDGVEALAGLLHPGAAPAREDLARALGTLAGACYRAAAPSGGSRSDAGADPQP